VAVIAVGSKELSRDGKKMGDKEMKGEQKQKGCFGDLFACRFFAFF
jgi:hypothetical protein